MLQGHYGDANACQLYPYIRAMRKAFKKHLSSSGDASAEISSAEIDHRVKLAIETDDPDLIIDLRHLNTGRPGDTFDVFFREFELIVEEITAADDRRHGVAHMSEFLSIKDLMSQVKHRVPGGTPIPSESTVIHAFAPPNIHANTAQYYTGRINLKHVVQRRQLRAFHADAYWCSALYKYLKELAVLNRDSCMFISCDDKAQVNFGEPGFMISSGVRGKKSIVPTTTTLGSLEHDVNQKGSIIPIVTLICDVPVDMSSSFCRGNVHVTLKESVFQPSCSYRFGLELIQLLRSGRIWFRCNETPLHDDCASKISQRKDLCAHCAKKDCFPNKDLKNQFKTALPICELS